MENVSRLTSNGYLSKRTTNSPSGTQSNCVVALLKNVKNPSRSFDGGDKPQGDNPCPTVVNAASNGIDKIQNGSRKDDDHNLVEKPKTDSDDVVSGALYDMLQKEVVTLRKVCHEKAQSIKDKDDAIEVRNYYSF